MFGGRKSLFIFLSLELYFNTPQSCCKDSGKQIGNSWSLWQGHPVVLKSHQDGADRPSCCRRLLFDNRDRTPRFILCGSGNCMFSLGGCFSILINCRWTYRWQSWFSDTMTHYGYRLGSPWRKRSRRGRGWIRKNDQFLPSYPPYPLEIHKTYLSKIDNRCSPPQAKKIRDFAV